MTAENKIQSNLIKYLKRKGCYVIKTRPGVGTPVGCPDVIALLEGAWFAFEVKATAKSPFRALQKDTLAKLDDWSFARTIHGENYNEIISELEVML